MLIEKIRNVSKDLKINNINDAWFYNSDYALRFEILSNFSPFGKDGKVDEYYFKATRKKALEIYDSLNFNFDILVVELNWYGTEDNVEEIFVNEMNEYIEAVKLPYPNEESDIKIIECIEKLPNGKMNKEIQYTKLYYWDINKYKLYIKRLFLEIAKKDFEGKLNGINSYLVDSKNSVVLNFYDDRGMDLLSAEKEKLLPYYKSLNSYLLDYDRGIMNDIFKE